MRQRSPLADDALLRRYFPDLAERLPRQRVTSLGSGVIVAPEGFVLTNHHVIEGADDIQLVLHDGRRIAAHVRGIDPESDLAVLKADGDDLPAITFGNERARAGRRHGARDRQSVRLRQHGHLGDRERARPQPSRHQPLRGLHPDRRRDQSRQLGRRAGRRRGQPDRHQQHDLLAVGRIARHRLRDSRVDRAQRARADHPRRRGHARLARHRAAGPARRCRASPLAHDGGVAIRGIVRGGPADRAGIHPRDVVVEIDGKPIRDTPALLARIADLPPGSMRQGQDLARQRRAGRRRDRRQAAAPRSQRALRLLVAGLASAASRPAPGARRTARAGGRARRAATAERRAAAATRRRAA